MKGVARPRLRLLLMSTHKLSPFDHHHDSRIIIELFVCLFVCLFDMVQRRSAIFVEHAYCTIIDHV